MYRAIFLVTLLVLIKTAVSIIPIDQCREVVDSFNPCMGFVEGTFLQPSPECCAGVGHLNAVVKFISPGARVSKDGGNIGEIQRVCECIEMMGQADHPRFLPDAVNSLPHLCALTLNFPISVGMDCSQFRMMKDLDTEISN